MDQKVLIIESTSKKKPLLNDYSDTSIVHCRNSLILKEALGADLIEGEYKLDEILKNKYDVIICCYASPYAPNIPYRAILNKKKQVKGKVFIYIQVEKDQNIPNSTGFGLF